MSSQPSGSSPGRQLVRQVAFTSFHTSISPEGSLESIADNEQDAEWDVEILAKYPLLDYLQNLALPAFNFRALTNMGNLRHIKRSLSRWPEYRELKRERGSRTLKQVMPLGHWEQVVLLTQNALEPYSDIFIENKDMEEEEDAQALRLPSPPLVGYEPADIEVLSNIQNELELATVMKNYVLTTASEAVRMMLRYPADAPISEKLKFKIANSLSVVHHARWDIFALPADAFNTMPLTVIFVPPWYFGLEDFKEFTAAQIFENGALDSLNTKPFTASDVLWAVIHDICKNRGHKFVITNYFLWSFGDLNHDYTQARVTEPFEASTLEFNGGVSSGAYRGMNPVQILVCWMMVAQGLVGDIGTFHSR